MIRNLILVFAALFCAPALAGFPFEATLEEMAQEADHILVGRVTGVDMIDGSGKPVQDREARIGPGLENTIRILITVDEILVTDASDVPSVIPVPLASHLHYSLGQISDAHEGDTLVRLVLLQGDDFTGIKPGVFLRSLSDKDEALRIYHAAHR
ncbi:hypothetical protein J6I90_00940 [Pseudidiomarina sp. 1APP75-32.1]|uniref:Uncharacterized protein n=1 Tax=Pseudidiomarina terrestris TaxID=2820060 RepID=A0AAW7QWI7_9GAMM|nr:MULTISPECIES: hypothetical protein [unclassified Pseudidiomarina]MDN7123443.1 hypothetical protein [Pseudidiomarina sp. 1APP75-32.1]MDN7127215.1 hypothetical protein [Pseudidiomarina sp. 1APR75-33.1]MDN7128831.1 hypothetical protein [Pseudidiomarina sp. 1APR75-15]